MSDAGYTEKLPPIDPRELADKINCYYRQQQAFFKKHWHAYVKSAAKSEPPVLWSPVEVKVTYLAAFHDEALPLALKILPLKSRSLREVVIQSPEKAAKLKPLTGPRLFGRLAARGDQDRLHLLADFLDDVREHLGARGTRQAGGNAPAGEAEAGGGDTPGDGKPFYKPKYFAQQWDIDDELLRRNAITGKQYTEGKVRRIEKKPASGKGKRAVYWYSEPDARRRWPDRFKIAEDDRTRTASKPPTA